MTVLDCIIRADLNKKRSKFLTRDKGFYKRKYKNNI